ncbi:tRNA-guanine(15) transglycosylase-like protein [Lipomyces oligophaga]|uniref:tRNA-guanine(15) transglycosylase-like protein n=1 Tax=Lipomyces oligophaga TaxID=45792 RepID=UPI0034CD960B
MPTSSKNVFQVISSSSVGRIGQYFVNSDTKCITTPNVLIPTSRGTVPHITPDLLTKHVKVSALFIGLEDFMTRNLKSSSLAKSNATVREFMSLLPSDDYDVPIFLCPRRSNLVPSSQPNKEDSLAVVTGYGYMQMSIKEYLEILPRLRDSSTVIVAPADLPLLVSSNSEGQGVASKGIRKVGGNRSKKLVSRNEKWSGAVLKKIGESNPVIVPLIPGVSISQQTPYLETIMGLDSITNEVSQQSGVKASGFTVMDLRSPFLETKPEVNSKVTREVNKVDNNPELTLSDLVDFDALPRFVDKNSVRIDMEFLSGPHDVVSAVERGYDFITGDWITVATDAGLGFRFDLNNFDEQDKKVGINLWDKEKYATDLSPIKEGCKCHTCTRHHRAFVNHLLNAREMLAWTLLQIHNIYVANEFMAAIQKSIKENMFAIAAKRFKDNYEIAVSEIGIENGPRTRGYQVKLIGPTPEKLNEKPYTSYQD